MARISGINHTAISGVTNGLVEKGKKGRFINHPTYTTSGINTGINVKVTIMLLKIFFEGKDVMIYPSITEIMNKNILNKRL